MALLVTGANGFVERVVCQRARVSGKEFVAATRSGDRGLGAATIAVGNIGPDTSWTAALNGCDAVIHLTARVHVMREVADDPLREFDRVNVEDTLALAQQAASVGVRRFVYVSSIKVNEEGTESGRLFRADDRPLKAILRRHRRCFSGLLQCH